LLAVRIVDFTRSLAEMAGSLAGVTRGHGLSLGDRACLALAAERGLTALTADRSWRDLHVGVDITLIR
jgi:PIN domain nuclease of toxin-antitoxin system